MQSHIAHLISLGRSGNQPDMVTAGKILALPEIASGLALLAAKMDEMRFGSSFVRIERIDPADVHIDPPKA